MSSTMHVVALIDKKSRQNGVEYGIGRYRYEENQFGTIRYKILPSARQTKYCLPFSEGDVVTMVGKFSYEIAEKIECFTINVSVATPFMKPSSGCWESEEIPLSSPYLSFNTQPIPGSLRQLENSQFVRTKSTLDSHYSRRSIDQRFRIGYQIDNDKWDNMALNWELYSQLFISGFFLHADNGELYIEATELDVDQSTRKIGKPSITGSTNSSVIGVSSLAKNFSRLMEMEKIPAFNYSNVLPSRTSEHSFVKPSHRSPPVNAIQINQNQQDPNNKDSLEQDFFKGIQAYHQIMQRMSTQGPPNPSSHPVVSNVTGGSDPPSAEQIAELISDQGTRHDKAGTYLRNNSKNNHPLTKQIPNISVWQLPQHAQQDIHQYNNQLHDIRHQQHDSTQRPHLTKSSHISSSHQNDREKTPLPPLPQQQSDMSMISMVPPRPESESGESQQASSDTIDSSNKKKSSSRKKSPNSDKSKSLRSVTRATLGNRFIVYEPKVGQDDEFIGNVNDLNSGDEVEKVRVVILSDNESNGTANDVVMTGVEPSEVESAEMEQTPTQKVEEAKNENE
ncbi:2305_t:CDS:2 [Dentiscutata erythropus]|uniref:2305_t:CDS:1 n=1 Tax=Dentiscutata erythropus TaxID=1348616 RepID=A0A9N9ANP6_9GLOM|nr:2305_t:CDS:2 [Dentiscutata erythropus]